MPRFTLLAERGSYLFVPVCPIRRHFAATWHAREPPSGCSWAARGCAYCARESDPAPDFPGAFRPETGSGGTEHGERNTQGRSGVSAGAAGEEALRHQDGPVPDRREVGGPVERLVKDPADIVTRMIGLNTDSQDAARNPWLQSDPVNIAMLYGMLEHLRGEIDKLIALGGEDARNSYEFFRGKGQESKNK